MSAQSAEPVEKVSRETVEEAVGFVIEMLAKGQVGIAQDILSGLHLRLQSDRLMTDPRAFCEASSFVH